MAKTNLFATATKVTKATAAPKEKEEINISEIKDEKGNVKYPTAGQLLLDYQKYHAQAAEAKTMLETKGSQLKEIGLELWAAKFEKEGKRPESFKMVGSVTREEKGKEPVVETGKLMFISSDAYKKVDEITATVLESKYNCITRKTTYSFNNELLDKYQEVISNALMNSKLIAPEDKANLILKSEDISITKGTIENVNLIASITGAVEKSNTHDLTAAEAVESVENEEAPVYDKFENVRELVRSVEPTFSLKNC